MIVRNFFSSLFLILVLFALQACGGKSDGDNTTFSTNINHTQQPIPATVIASSTTDSDKQEPDDNTHLASFYFSYDDSASTASKDLTLASLSASQKPNTHWGRPYEFLNAEVFNHFNAEVIAPFEISFGIYAAADGEVPLSAEPSDNLYALGVNLSGPTMTHEQRPNVVLTLLVDVSGSRNSTYATQTYDNIHSLLDVAKHGLQTMLGSLKPGDVLNLVTFSDSAEVVQQDWAYDSSNADFSESIHALRTTGSTNLNAGIALAYTTALSSYDSIKANRVIILTDAYANRGGN